MKCDYCDNETEHSVCDRTVCRFKDYVLNYKKISSMEELLLHIQEEFKDIFEEFE